MTPEYFLRMRKLFFAKSAHATGFLRTRGNSNVELSLSLVADAMGMGTRGSSQIFFAIGLEGHKLGTGWARIGHIDDEFAPLDFGRGCAASTFRAQCAPNCR